MCIRRLIERLSNSSLRYTTLIKIIAYVKEFKGGNEMTWWVQVILPKAWEPVSDPRNSCGGRKRADVCKPSSGLQLRAVTRTSPVHAHSSCIGMFTHVHVCLWTTEHSIRRGEAMQTHAPLKQLSQKQEGEGTNWLPLSAELGTSGFPEITCTNFWCLEPLPGPWCC